MRKFVVLSILTVFTFNICSPVFAADLSAFGLNVPNIQDISASEQSGPKSAGDMVLEAPIDTNIYRLGPGDLLSIHIIVGDSELSVDHNLLIGADGKIFFPNIGEIYLSGLSLKQAQDRLNAKIGSVYRERYKLYVLLSQPKKVKIYVSGMVKNPGPLAVFDNLRVSEVIGQAGGVASGASNRYIYIRRKGTDSKDELLKADLFEAYRSRDLSKDIRVQAGDIIEVPDANNVRVSQNSPDKDNDKQLFEGRETFVYIYGEVARSGRFEYIPGKKISDYISYAGGPTAKALLNDVTITRQVEGKAKQYQVKVSDVIYNGKAENDIEVLGGDVIRVPGNFFYVTDFTSFANTILLALTLYNTVAR